MQVQELLKDVEHPCHLSEDQDLGAFHVESLEKLRESLELATVILDEILVREEEYVGPLQRLVHIAMGHQLLVGESLICFLLLKTGVDLGWCEVGRLGHHFRYDALEMLDRLLQLRDPL